MTKKPYTEFKELPIKIKSSKNNNGRTYNFNVEISLEFAEIIMEMAAPFLNDLSDMIAGRAMRQKERLKDLQHIHNKKKYITIIALKILRISRKKDLLIDDVAIKIASQYDVSPNTLVNRSRELKSIRSKRLQAFISRRVKQLFKSGIKKKIIADNLGLTVHVVNKILEKQNLRIEK